MNKLQQSPRVGMLGRSNLTVNEHDLNQQIYHPPRWMFSTWHKNQIFTSMETANGIYDGGVVPNVNDTVISWAGNQKIEERVTAVDPVTHLSTLEPVEYPKNSNDIIIGVPLGIGNLASVAILYLNPNDPKLGCEVDYRLPITSIYGTAVSYARFFLGANIGPSGVSIGANYDNLGQFKNDRIPVELVDLYGEQTKRYIVRPGSLTQVLPEESLVTMVLYNDSNVQIAVQPLEVKHNGLVSSLVNRVLYVNRVYLETPYLNPLDSREILIPKNLLSQSFMPRIFKQYASGAREEMFIGTSNVTLYGWDDTINGAVNDRFEISLNYVLAHNERSESVSQFTGTHISSTYTVRVIDSDSETDVKLFVLPMYSKEDHLYKLEFYLYTGSRGAPLNVTDKVEVVGFVGNRYAEKQRIDFSIDLRRIPGMPETTYADTISLMLMNEPMATETMYRLWYFRDPERWFGERLRVQALNHFDTRTIDISNHLTQKDEWLEHMYHRACPLYDAKLSVDAPNPTFVDVTIGGVTRTVDIDTYWNGETPWDRDQVINTGDMVVLKWYMYSDSGERLDLAITNLPLEVI